MKCTECPCYFITPGGEPSCTNDGDVTNPEEDINCAEAGDEELEG